MLSQAAEHITCAGGGAQQHCSGNDMQRCAGICVCSKCGSSAASLPALLLGQDRPATERGREKESRGEQSIAWKQLSLQRAFTVKVCCPPPYFSKGKWALPALPLAKKLPAALSKRPNFLRGRRCSAIIGYPGRLSSPSAPRGRRYPRRMGHLAVMSRQTAPFGAP